MNKFSITIFVGLILILQIACGQSPVNQDSLDATPTAKPLTAQSFPILKIHKTAYADACNRKDWDKVFSLTYPKLVEMTGGRQSFKDSMDKEFANTGEFLLMTGEPVQIAAVDKQLFAVIPSLLKQRVPEGIKTARLIIIGVSEDNGENWMFAEATNKETRKSLFPIAAAKLDIPEIPPPSLEKQP